MKRNRKQITINQFKKWLELDTFIFDYGGVVSYHYCNPWHANLSKLLCVDSKRVRELLSESSEQGRNYRLGKITRDEFWGIIIELANPSKNSDLELLMHSLEDNWAKSYQINLKMINLIQSLRVSGKKVGIMMNTDAHRHIHIENSYQISNKVDFIVSSFEHRVVKPDVSAYITALKVSGNEATPSKVLYIDDREKNVRPCFELGMQGFLFENHENLMNVFKENGVLSMESE